MYRSGVNCEKKNELIIGGCVWVECNIVDLFNCKCIILKEVFSLSVKFVLVEDVWWKLLERLW